MDESTAVIQNYVNSEVPILQETARALMARTNNQPIERMELVERVLVLRSVAIFGDTPENLLVDIARLARVVNLKIGETFINKGEIGSCMYIIVEGRVRVHDGDLFLAEMGARDFVGELSLLDPEPRSASVTATEATQLLTLDHDAFFELMSDSPEVAQRTLSALCRRIRNQNALLAEIA